MERRSPDRIATAARGRSRGTGAGGGHGRGRPSRRRRPHLERPRCRAALRRRRRSRRHLPGRARAGRRPDAGPAPPARRAVAVLSTCDLEAAGLAGPDEFPDAFVDMAGPGADRSPFGSTIAVVLRFVPAPGARAPRTSIARSGARPCGSRATSPRPRSGPSPTTSTRYAWPARRPPSRLCRPSCAIVQVASEGPLTDTFLRGAPPARARADGARPARAAGRRAHERRVRLAGGPQRHRDLPGQRARARAVRGARRPAAVRRADPHARLPATPPRRSSAPRTRAAALARRARGRRRDLHDVLVGQLAHRHDAHRPRVRAARDRHRRAGVRDERRPDRPRPRGRLPDQHRQRGRARRRVDARAG